MLFVLVGGLLGPPAREGRCLVETTAREGACGKEPLFDLAQNQVNSNALWTFTDTYG